MKKITLEQANELLTQLGAGVVVVDNEADADKDFDFDAVVSEVKPEPQTVNKDDIYKEATGKIMGSLYSNAANVFGISRNTLNGVPHEELFKTLKETLSSRYTKTETELREQLEKANQERDEEIERITKEHEFTISKERERLTERNIRDSFRSAYDKVPKRAGDLDFLTENSYLMARQKYNLKWNEEKGAVEFYDKNDPDKKVIVNNKDEFNVNSFVTEYNKNIGNDATDTRHQPPKDVVNNTAITTQVDAGGGSDPYAEKLNSFMEALEQA